MGSSGFLRGYVDRRGLSDQLRERRPMERMKEAVQALDAIRLREEFEATIDDTGLRAQFKTKPDALRFGQKPTEGVVIELVDGDSTFRIGALSHDVTFDDPVLTYSGQGILFGRSNEEEALIITNAAFREEGEIGCNNENARAALTALLRASHQLDS